MTSLFLFLRAAQQKLAEARIDDPALDARLLIGAVLGLDRTELLVQNARILTAQEQTALEAIIARRAVLREPVARILGERAFWGLSFALNEATLEPRPDSETLIEEALRVFPDFKEGRFLDLGTGTGCLLLALLHERPKATGLGIDRASRAVAKAQENARRLGFGERANFRQGDWFAGLNETFDVITCNPPYIPSAHIEDLQAEVRLFDPKAALDGGKDGLDAYRALAPLCARFLKPEGVALFEVGVGQSEDVALLLRAGGLADLTIRNDLAGVPRCVMGRKKT